MDKEDTKNYPNFGGNKIAREYWEFSLSLKNIDVGYNYGNDV